MNTGQLAIVLVVGSGVFTLALMVDLLNLYVRVRTGRRMASTATPESRASAGLPVSLRDVLRDELYAQADEWRNLRGIAALAFKAVAWIDARLASLPVHLHPWFGDNDEAVGWRSLCVVPLLLLWGRAPDYLIAWGVALGYLVARPRPRLVLVTAWVVSAVALRPTDLIVSGLATGAVVTFAVRRRDREAMLASLCIVATAYGLLVPALALSARVLGPRSLNVAAWVAVAVPALVGASVLDARMMGPDLPSEARHVRTATASWLATVVERPDAPSALRAFVATAGGFGSTGGLIRDHVAFAFLLVAVPWALAALPLRAGAERFGAAAGRTVGTLVVSLGAAYLVLPAIGASGAWTPLVTVLTGMAITRASWSAPKRDAEAAIRAFVGIGADLLGMVAAVMAGFYFEDFGKDGLLVAADVLLALVCALGFVWVGWAEHAREKEPVRIGPSAAMEGAGTG